MIWLLGIGRWLKEAISAVFGFIREYPWQFACIALLGLSLWFLHGRTDARADLADRIAAEKAATGAQKRVNAAAQTHYKEVADVADTKHEDMVAEAWDATARFINDRRVQPEHRTCKAPSPSGGDSAPVPAKVPPGAVMVDEADVRRCADAAVYAVAAHDWAQSLKVPENLLPAH